MNREVLQEEEGEEGEEEEGGGEGEEGEDAAVEVGDVVLLQALSPLADSFHQHRCCSNCSQLHCHTWPTDTTQTTRVSGHHFQYGTHQTT